MQNTILLRSTQMTRSTRQPAFGLAALGLAAAGTLAMTGCGSGAFSNTPAAATAGVAMQGHVFGGQQPVQGATIQLYAAGQTGYNVASTALISSTVTSDANGNFNITGDYTCPYSTSQVYITATGGSAGSMGTNANLAMMSALGACGNLSASSFISINELTTVASAYAFSPFMSSPTQLSTTPTNLTGLSNATATVNRLVNIQTGQTPGATLPASATEPTAELNTLADILASCVNSAGGTAGDTSNCGKLFTDATPSGGTAPTDTLTAILDIAKNPANNASALFLLVPTTPPFQPALTAAPTAYTVSLRYLPTGTGAFSTPSASAVDASGNVWVTNSGNNTLSVVSAIAGTPTAYSGGGLNAPSAIAFDSFGDAWVPNKGNSTLSVFTAAGAGTVALTSHLSAPSGVAIDGQGLIWVTNSTGNSVTEVTPSHISVTGSTVYSTAGTTPVAVAINPH